VPTCPAGHDSATTDYCDECGAPMSGAPSSEDPAATAALAAVPPAAKRCAACGEPRDGRFCEVCGHDADRPVPAAPAAAPEPGRLLTPAAGPDRPAAVTWTAVVRADREWFDHVRATGGSAMAEVEFPPYCPERRFVLSGSQLRIGRRSRSRGIHPEIDLTGPPLDPGVSALHALLVSRPDGGWDLVDVESTNGTVVGEATAPVPPHRPVPLASGDRIKLGAWTTITVTASPADDL
jgi:hypothetical protein